jgi:ferric-dicitrate binding protein FerR (iron transport regulator)
MLPALGYAQTAGRITKFAGPAFLVRPPSQTGEKPVIVAARAGDLIHWRDELQTQDNGRMRVQLDDGSILSLGQRTKLVLTKHDPRTQQSNLELLDGKIRATVVHLARPDAAFAIRTSNCVITWSGGDVAVDATDPVGTAVWTVSGKTMLDCSTQRIRLEIPAGYHALSSEGTIHPFTPDMLDQVDKFSLLKWRVWIARRYARFARDQSRAVGSASGD